MLAWAARTPDILSFEPDFVLQSSSLPNDPGFTSQWGLNNTAIDGYGVIGADMQVSLVNDGPVTIALDSRNPE